MRALLLLTPAACLAAVITSDPSDVIPPSLWAADNAVVPNYSAPLPEAQPSITAANTFNTTTSIDHQTLSTNANDTSVILVTGGDLNASYVDVIKTGYASNPKAAGAYGVNAAVHVANGARASISHINVTAHNGAANVHASGDGGVVRLQGAWLYSSGPSSPGLHAIGSATIIGRHVKHFSGGVRSSAFSAGAPGGSVYVYDSVSHTQGLGSATYYAVGTVIAENTVSLSERTPVVLADGPSNVTLTNCDSIAGSIAGVAFYSSGARQAGANLRLIDSKITASGRSLPGLWFGNTIVNVFIQSSQLKTDSGVLVVANSSSISPDFTGYGGAETSSALPAQVSATIEESTLTGDLLVYNGSSISWSLTKHSTWIGAVYSAYGAASFNVALDSTSTWILSRNSSVQRLIVDDRSLSNIKSNGYTLHYDATVQANSWLGGKTIGLAGGGSVQPLAA